MYKPPPGRPISSPPCDYQTLADKPKRVRRWRRMPEDVRESIRADYRSGMSLDEIAAKRGYKGRGSIARVLRDINKPPPVPNKEWHITDKDTWVRRMSAGVRRSLRDEDRQARVLCKKLNKSETAGIWLTQQQCVDSGLCKTTDGVGQRIKRLGWQRRRWKDNGRITILLIPNDDEWAKRLRNPLVPDVSLPSPVVVAVPPPPPSRWQRAVNRIVGWFR